MLEPAGCGKAVLRGCHPERSEGSAVCRYRDGLLSVSRAGMRRCCVPTDECHSERATSGVASRGILWFALATNQESSRILHFAPEPLLWHFTFGVSNFLRCHPEVEQSGAEGSAFSSAPKADLSPGSGRHGEQFFSACSGFARVPRWSASRQSQPASIICGVSKDAAIRSLPRR